MTEEKRTFPDKRGLQKIGLLNLTKKKTLKKDILFFQCMLMGWAYGLEMKKYSWHKKMCAQVGTELG